MNSENRSRTVRKDSLDMATIVPHRIVNRKTVPIGDLQSTKSATTRRIMIGDSAGVVGHR